ncbi:Cloroperoxidase [Lactarius akahatsu]|uniref:Cloroperoxidase n=1 Tax=Lactarius akahatsu TaxID=416441 RepID=A0AAD4LRM7_9AGAM|nr:Cloroperoxidase [Lactarius akahatsu]
MSSTATTSPTQNHNGDSSHEWVPKQPGDVRSPCPALNTLANHGYLPHDGKQLTAPILIHALQEGYGLSTPLAHLLVHGGIFLLGQTGAFGLNDLARHNRIEHDASLVHDDAKGRDEYAPISPSSTMVMNFLAQAEDGRVLTAEDVARARVERESQCPVLNSLHAEVARGEMAIALGLFGQENADHQEGVPLDMLRQWLAEERLPEGWKPTHTQGLLQTIRTAREIRSLMATFKKEGAAGGVHRDQPEGFKLEISPIS